MEENQSTRRGSCLCGGVSYKLTGEPLSMSHCHCVGCRKAHGAAFSTNLELRKGQLAFLRGEDSLHSYRSTSGTHRGFCPKCGSTVICWGDEEPDRVYVCASTLDSPPRARPEYHIWVSSKAPWYEIQDALPCYQGNVDD